jgi:hypothetical protein
VARHKNEVKIEGACLACNEEHAVPGVELQMCVFIFLRVCCEKWSNFVYHFAAVHARNDSFKIRTQIRTTESKLSSAFSSGKMNSS